MERKSVLLFTLSWSLQWADSLASLSISSPAVPSSACRVHSFSDRTAFSASFRDSA